MQSDAAVFRTGETLSEGSQDLRGVCVLQRRQGQRSLDGLELRPDRDAGTVQSAGAGGGHHAFGAAAPESRGAHAREDFPDRDDHEWQKHTLVWVDDAGNTRFDYRPVHMYTLTDEVEVVPPKSVCTINAY
jgi:succinate dehydrogenase / fumarate reductase flavoprotein subunit